MPNNALLLVAHGSRRVSANQEIMALTERLSTLLGARFSATRCAFLELAQPGIAEAIDSLVADGAADITVLPYFLAAGSHVSDDIPSIIDARRSAHPQLKLEVLPYLGSMPELLDLLAASVDRELA